ncbi:26S proteasome regulatory complex, subunit RPN12 [Guillardia theta CCMP2712]|uniref:26S proteasome regulatory complex, subunit RPN12 n=2 Tax=Guillardia theta TaxID=55529 RepID=L1IWD1_GUITC|nr:26S proteasome regulatory complex, subunit RPN12 [Guillardia theta CCMP2712]EKX40397.1 26S proteasome regulatory complex, subunit RPN12 [Guillardia theta CCMP2712]|mmetsp:Transcript_28365/g.91775  ORF Transcript_28365/g.91775 Transcript_28365/m.91775 type:complete len:265 (+) Transcript_28365:35-829(+)|eukprot:XP_005827377.1 26S proteasome regulatory complex, subunit RPN12 [Guillardia theta CCMP2712]
MSGEAASMLPRLKAAINGGDMDGAKKLMVQLKILMTSFKSTPGVVAANEANVQELMIVREFYELGCLVSAQSEDIEGFERHFAVVKSCYTDYAGVLPQSEKQYELQGLNLLCLLAQSKIAEFHTELELIPVDVWENPFIKFPINLEQYLMEGSYQKVLESPGGVPSKSYSYFVRLLSGTVRDSIAESSEAAYDWMPIAQALKMLSMGSAKDLSDYVVSKQREWEVDVNANVVRFREDQKVDLEVPSQRLIVETLSYAKELERIV